MFDFTHIIKLNKYILYTHTHQKEKSFTKLELRLITETDSNKPDNFYHR